MVSAARKLAVLVISVFTALVCARDARALSLTIAWDAPGDPTIIGYAVSYGTSLALSLLERMNATAAYRSLPSLQGCR